MYDIIKIAERIKTIKNIKSDSAVAEVLGMNQSTFAERKRKNSIPFEELADFCQREDISFHWLIFGSGKSKISDIDILIDGIAEKAARYVVSDDDRILRTIELLNQGPDEDKDLIRDLLEARARAREAWNKLKP